jgi:hypothetical protein
MNCGVQVMADQGRDCAGSGMRSALPRQDWRGNLLV